MTPGPSMKVISRLDGLVAQFPVASNLRRSSFGFVPQCPQKLLGPLWQREYSFLHSDPTEDEFTSTFSAIFSATNFEELFGPERPFAFNGEDKNDLAGPSGRISDSETLEHPAPLPINHHDRNDSEEFHGNNDTTNSSALIANALMMTGDLSTPSPSMSTSAPEPIVPSNIYKYQSSGMNAQDNGGAMVNYSAETHASDDAITASSLPFLPPPPQLSQFGHVMGIGSWYRRI
ncbi:hypothetical protein BT96DRAFT_1032136 [Gymnopus androsaceus JB14]|uniref:Uncharacterized protein n=1 Tax=Gymnopus androsaceus JB14 TaxID=1447944 RepID=A0A6A4HLH6_9AGAR|nr:hypothetical protein BT96DRAFT_1032136 [Gymnopus androsaceus JB14]